MLKNSTVPIVYVLFNNLVLKYLSWAEEAPHLNGVHLTDPVLPSDPLTGKFHFACEVDYPTGPDDGARFLVSWWFDGSKVCVSMDYANFMTINTGINIVKMCIKI